MSEERGIRQWETIYDTIGQLLSVTDAAGNVTRMSYDNRAAR